MTIQRVWALARMGLVALSMVLVLAPAAAQEIKLYEHVGYVGADVSFTTDIPNLVDEGFNDVASSLRVTGRWEVCEDVNYGGRCRVFDADSTSLVPLGWNDIISSVRRVSGGGGGGGGAVPPGAQNNVDRPGDDYDMIESISPTACQNRCNAEGRCRAWTFVRAGVQGPTTRCYLKDRVPAPNNDGCCISGVKAGGGGGGGGLTIPPGAQNNVDRPGDDYDMIEGGAVSPTNCKSRCDSDGRCRAWTFVRAGVQGPTPRCYLKDRVPAPVNDGCCVSGTTAGGGGGGIVIPPGAQNNVDRPGNDYDRITGAGMTPGVCKSRCDGDARCRAWTFVRAGIQEVTPVCYLKSPAPGAVSDTCCVSGLRSGPSESIPAGAQNNVDRPGNDFDRIAGAGMTPGVCKSRCDGNPNCRAWTYVRPGFQGPTPVCYLKRPAPGAVSDACCVSGVSAPREPIGPGMSDNTDRPGNDYRVIDLTLPRPDRCQAQCEADPSCRAWTYVRPGVQGPRARCYFKRPAPAANPDTCCISGVNRFAPGGEIIGPGMRDNSNRPGFDLRSFSLRTPDPALCQQVCFADPNCRAWVYNRPGTRGSRAVCELKALPGPRVEDTCCISGRKPGFF